jgi:hypothetical protein
MSESLKVMRLRWIESAQQMYDVIDKDINAKHKLDELILVHNEMIKQICDVVDELEAEQIQSLQTLQYITNITNRMKEQ